MIWEVVDHKKGENPSITFKYHCRDGEEGTVFYISIFFLGTVCIGNFKVYTAMTKQDTQEMFL